MKKKLFILGAILCSLCGCDGDQNRRWKNELRAPSYPLVTIDPYTSAWSAADHLYDVPVKHWTGKDFPLLGVAKIDGKAYRFLGSEELRLSTLADVSEQGAWESTYTTEYPGECWEMPGFQCGKQWKKAVGAYGTQENESTARTQWGEEKIWVRRMVTLTEDLIGRNVYLNYSHDDDAVIYVNGIKVVDTGNCCQKDAFVLLSTEVVQTLKAGDNLIAGYCHNGGGNGLLDFGLMVEQENSRLFAETATQLSVDVQATQTYYSFTCGPINLDITFTAPMLMDDLDLMTRPVNYLSYNISSNDGKQHDVFLYFEAGPQWAVDRATQLSVSNIGSQDGIIYASTANREQPILEKQGDDLRIDWGHFYLASIYPTVVAQAGDALDMRSNFLNGNMTDLADTNGYNHLSLTLKADTKTQNDGYLMFAYDDIYSIQFFGERLRPFWNRQGTSSIFEQMKKAVDEYDSLMERCTTFDLELMTNATRVGGRQYAELCALAYRQVMAAHKLVESPQNELLYLSKENFSNGCINTVDLTYPSAPLYLLYNPDLLKGMMNGIFYYSESGRWTKPFAAHDLGTYPHANGQVYGGDMPIEESGNMLILTAAIAAVEGNANYASMHWTTLTTWVEYLVENGLDPENQLCTDDFAGHFAHNTNLSVKAILGIASYGYLAEMLDKKEIAETYLTKAKEMAQEWAKMADDGDHYRLTFDQPGSWSQKYNLVWDKLMGWNIFDADIIRKEIAFYLTKQNTYGLPLDNRETYTKSDWIMWTATLAPDKTTFEQFIVPVYRYMDQTSDRVPMNDWSWTLEPKQRGFQARSVIGGYFIKMLEEKMSMNNSK